MDIYTWFNLIQNSKDDIEVAHHLIHKLEGYKKNFHPPKEDIKLIIDFLGAVRLHQLKSTPA